MTLVDDEVSRLWVLLTELSAQLSANREHCEALKAQCEKLKAQAAHNGTGFALRRFNVDITKEQFESEIERFNATLILENQALQYENRQLSILLKDYEGTLDGVMAKFRGFAAATQQYELESARHYESLLLQYTGSSTALQNNSFTKQQQQGTTIEGGLNSHEQPQSSELDTSNPDAFVPGHQQPGLTREDPQKPVPLLVQDPLAVQMSLSHLSSLLRKALRSIQGEDPSDDDDEDEEDDEGAEGEEKEEEDDDDDENEVSEIEQEGSSSSSSSSSDGAEQDQGGGEGRGGEGEGAEEGSMVSVEGAGVGKTVKPNSSASQPETAKAGGPRRRKPKKAKSTTSSTPSISKASSSGTTSKSHTGSDGGASTTRARGGQRARSLAARTHKLNKKKVLHHDASEGGYLQLLSDGIDRADLALERDTELERLHKENAELRNLLGIATDLPPLPVVVEETAGR